MHGPVSEARQAEPESLLDRTAALASRRQFLIGAGLIGAAAIAQARLPEPVNPRLGKKQFDKWVPDAVGPWRFVTSSGVVLPTPDALMDRLYDDVVTRVYQAPGRSVVMIAIAYNNIQDGVVQLHRPEVCYPAGGFTLTPTRPVEIVARGNRIGANFFTAASDERTEQILYFTRIGDAFPNSWAQQRLAVIKDNLLGRIPDGMLFRASVLSTDARSAVATLSDFIRRFDEASAPPLRKLLLGRVST